MKWGYHKGTLQHKKKDITYTGGICDDKLEYPEDNSFYCNVHMHEYRRQTIVGLAGTAHMG